VSTRSLISQTPPRDSKHTAPQPGAGAVSQYYVLCYIVNSSPYESHITNIITVVGTLTVNDDIRLLSRPRFSKYKMNRYYHYCKRRHYSIIKIKDDARKSI